MKLSSTLEKQLQNKNLWWFLGGLIVFYLLRSDLEKYFSDKEKTNAGSDPNARLALLIRDACNPSGFPFLINVDFTRVEFLYELAAQITNYEAVANSYKVQFGENLTERLGKELEASEFDQFFKLVQAKGGGVTPVQNSIGKTAIAATTVDVLDFEASTKSIKRLKAGETVGKIVASAQFNTSRGYVEYWVIEFTEWLFFTKKGYVEKTKVYVQ
ncbi:MAG: hypothetical protein ACK41O_17405 [Runella zeae]